MPKPDPAHLTSSQQKWFASVRDGLERDTGKSLAEWVEIARSCPETQPRRRLMWFKETHGLLQNRASLVLAEAFPPQDGSWSEPDGLRTSLWPAGPQLEILKALETLLGAWPEVIVGQRKTFTAFSRRYQFAALKPSKGGALLGVAADGGVLEPATGKEGWSERLAGKAFLAAPAEVAGFEEVLRLAWDRS